MDYTVDQGDCLLSIAESTGILWETIWNHPNNAALKQRRNNDPNVLLPGDVLYIPDIQERHEMRGVDQRHKFKKKTTKAKVKLRLLDMKRRPRRSLQYAANVDGDITRGSTDGDGYLTLQVKAAAREVRLTVTEHGRNEEYVLPLGHIDPADSVSGVQQRLTNLGYRCASDAGSVGEATHTAVRAFQKEMQLPETGEIDDATRDRLKQMHGC